MGIVWTLRAIFWGVVCGDFLLAFLIWLLLERRERAENKEIRKALTGFPPDETPDAARQAKEARDATEAWTRLQNYSAEDAYGMGNSG